MVDVEADTDMRLVKTRKNLEEFLRVVSDARPQFFHRIQR